MVTKFTKAETDTLKSVASHVEELAAQRAPALVEKIRKQVVSICQVHNIEPREFAAIVNHQGEGAPELLKQRIVRNIIHGLIKREELQNGNN